MALPGKPLSWFSCCLCQIISHRSDLFLTLSKRLLFSSGAVYFVHFQSWSSSEGLTQQETQYGMSLWGWGHSIRPHLLTNCFHSHSSWKKAIFFFTLSRSLTQKVCNPVVQSSLFQIVSNGRAWCSKCKYIKAKASPFCFLRQSQLSFASSL